MTPRRRGVGPTVTTPGARHEAVFRRALVAAAPGLTRPLPWIGEGDPWAVLVSEVMLQQTPTARVVGPWTSFMERFATPRSCADATLADVLREWGTLGYPRRARALHQAARAIRDDHDGVVPSDVEALRRLPGVGPYTAAAVASFAYGRHVAVLDTNVGRVLARAVTGEALGAAAARDVAQRLLPRQCASEFNQAMIDLGATYCRSTPRCEQCPVRRACLWRRNGGEDPAPRSAGVSRPQPKFEGSERQVRGRVMGHLRESSRSVAALGALLPGVDTARLDAVVTALIEDGLVRRSRGVVALAEG